MNQPLVDAEFSHIVRTNFSGQVTWGTTLGKVAGLCAGIPLAGVSAACGVASAVGYAAAGSWTQATLAGVGVVTGGMSNVIKDGIAAGEKAYQATKATQSIYRTAKTVASAHLQVASSTAYMVNNYSAIKSTVRRIVH